VALTGQQNTLQVLLISKVNTHRKTFSLGFVSFVLVEDRSKTYPWTVYAIQTVQFPTLLELANKLQDGDGLPHQVARYHFPEMPERSLIGRLAQKLAA
jgi:hypothetical protein